MGPTRRSVLGYAAVLLLAGPWAACGAVGGGRGAVSGTVAVFVRRDAWTEPQELLALIDGAAEAGADRVVFEDRRDGTVVHGSGYEPWSEHLNGIEPGFDPLALALERARARGLGFDVAMQVVPVWSGAVPPREPQHPWHVLRGWRWVDARGTEQALRDGALVSLDPCLPEVRRYLASVLIEPLRRYDVDGLLLIDTRFPKEYPSVARGNPGDPPQGERTRALYRATTGLAPEDDAAAWHRWRATQLTDLVRLVRAELDALPPRPGGRTLIVEVEPDPAIAREQHQDWRAWLDQGLVDGVAPVDDGRRDPELLRERRELWRERTAGGARVAPEFTLSPGAVPTTEWRAEVDALRGATGAILLRGTEPWLAGDRGVLREALGR